MASQNERIFAMYQQESASLKMMRESLAKEHEFRNLSIDNMNQLNTIQKENIALHKSISMYSTLVESQQKSI
jgi:hypothetical protein